MNRNQMNLRILKTRINFQKKTHPREVAIRETKLNFIQSYRTKFSHKKR